MKDSDRLEMIEAKLAHQEKAVSELNEVVYRQQKQFDDLERKYEHLLQRYRELQSTVGGDDSQDIPPPHY